MFSLSASAACVLLSGAVWFMVGCSESGPKLAPVRGRVTMDDLPLVEATVEFSPDGEGSTSLGITDQDGNYELVHTRDKKGALVGSHTVDIYFDPDIARSVLVPIPERYNVNTELREEVADDDNVIDFELTSDE